VRESSWTWPVVYVGRKQTFRFIWWDAELTACCAVQPEGLKQANELVGFYKDNALILREAFKDLGFSVYGGDNAPYVWVGFPGQPSWDVFAEVRWSADHRVRFAHTTSADACTFACNAGIVDASVVIYDWQGGVHAFRPG